jgi:type VI secretion system secreted protein Hcp
MKTRTFFLIVSCLLAVQLNFGALNAYLRLTDSENQPIEGSVTDPGQEGSILVVSMQHSVSTPRDAASGLPTGKRQHKPFVITKLIDKASPLLYGIQNNGEVLVNFNMTFWRPTLTSEPENYYTITLTNARIISIHQLMQGNQDTETAEPLPVEQVSFTYDTISWTYMDGTTSTAGWQYDPTDIIITDLNGDGFVDMLDLAIFANDWLAGTQSSR